MTLGDVNIGVTLDTQKEEECRARCSRSPTDGSEDGHHTGCSRRPDGFPNDGKYLKNCVHAPGYSADHELLAGGSQSTGGCSCPGFEAIGVCPHLCPPIVELVRHTDCFAVRRSNGLCREPHYAALKVTRPIRAGKISESRAQIDASNAAESVIIHARIFLGNGKFHILIIDFNQSGRNN